MHPLSYGNFAQIGPYSGAGTGSGASYVASVAGDLNHQLSAANASGASGGFHLMPNVGGLSQGSGQPPSQSGGRRRRRRRGTARKSGGRRRRTRRTRRRRRY